MSIIIGQESRFISFQMVCVHVCVRSISFPFWFFTLRYIQYRMHALLHTENLKNYLINEYSRVNTSAWRMDTCADYYLLISIAFAFILPIEQHGTHTNTYSNTHNKSMSLLDGSFKFDRIQVQELNCPYFVLNEIAATFRDIYQMLCRWHFILWKLRITP